MVEKNGKSEDLILTDDVEKKVDDLDVVEEEELSKDRIEKLRQRLKTCEHERLKNLEGWQRTQADFLNLKRRSEEGAFEMREYTLMRHIEKLLPLLDSFGLATAGTSWDRADAQLKKGFEQIKSQFESLLNEYGVEVIAPGRVPFNPSFHEALSERDVEDSAEDGVVQELVQPGYAIGKRVIRPARVTVGKLRGRE
jgi:molecular chaperone GrpE